MDDCQKWMVNMDCQNGWSIWTVKMDGQNNGQNGQSKCTVKIDGHQRFSKMDGQNGRLWKIFEYGRSKLNGQS